MKRYSVRRRLLASTIIGGAALAGFGAPAWGQASTSDEVSEVVVTGTRIPSPNLESVSPVTSIGTQDLKAQGITRVEDMVNTLPQAFASQGAAISNGATGTATVNLRGLGSSRTMVLIDGRRLMPGSPIVPSPDLNFIPAALVQRVDVLTGGASAVYGADAVAGVVNFIMQKNFEGVRIDAQYSLYQHNNDSPVADVVRAAGAASPTPEFYGLPKNNVRDGEASEVTLVIGVNAPDGRGNVTAYAGYRHVEPILQANRDYSACSLNSGDSFADAGCGGSGTAFPARVGGFVVDVAGPGNTFRPRVATDVYNFGPTNYYQRPDDRYVLGAFANYQIASWATAYADIMMMDDRSTAQIAPGGVFAGNFSINCANPLLSDQQRGLLAATAASGGGTCATNPAGTFTGIVARRNIEGGGRQSVIEHTQYRYVIGLRGDLNENWNYDLFGQFGRVLFGRTQTGFFRTTAIQNALNVVSVNGVPTCVAKVNGSDPNCVPYNIFQLGQVTPEQLAYLDSPSFSSGALHQRVVNFSLGGDLTDYGVKSPWSEDGVGISFGAEYRREQLEFSSDFISSSGGLNGSGGAAPPVNGSFDVYEAFAEARVPLVTDMAFAKRLQLELAYRYSDYSTGKTTDTYKVAGDWQVTDDLRIRASYQRAVRAPDVTELFSPQAVGLGGTNDPCAGLTATNPLVATCAQVFGLTTAQVLAIERNPANQYQQLNGGNPNLDPETSDTVSFGVVLTPTFIPGLNVSFDYFNIKVRDFINNINVDLVLNRCVQQQDPFFCSLVHRDAQGSLWLSPDGFTEATQLNTGALRTKGLDVNASYRVDLEDLGVANGGGLSFSLVGTWLDSLETQPLPGDAFYDCAGLFGAVCSTTAPTNPEWRHKLRVTWATPFEFGDWVRSLGVSLQWRHFGKVTLDAFDDDPQLVNPGGQYETDRVLERRNYVDLSATWTMRDNINFRAGINNLFDKDPPLVGSSSCPGVICNGNTFPQVYDAFGRYLFLGLTADF